MRTVLSLVLVFIFAGIASAQPPQMRWKGKVRDLGDPDRLEKPQAPDEVKNQQPQPKHAQNFGPNRNKYGGPKNGNMRYFGGDPWKQFSQERPWGRMGGPVGPPRDFRGYPFYYGRPGRQYHGGRQDFKAPHQWKERESNRQICPFCGTKMS